MSQKIAVTISSDIQSISFSKDQVVKVTRTPVRYHTQQSLPDALPTVRYEGDEWPVLRLYLRMVDRETLDRLRAVQAMSGLLTVYYAMQEDPGLFITGFIYPDTEERRFIRGLNEAYSEYVVTILECE